MNCRPLHVKPINCLTNTHLQYTKHNTSIAIFWSCPDYFVRIGPLQLAYQRLEPLPIGFWQTWSIGRLIMNKSFRHRFVIFEKAYFLLQLCSLSLISSLRFRYFPRNRFLRTQVISYARFHAQKIDIHVLEVLKSSLGGTYF